MHKNDSKFERNKFDLEKGKKNLKSSNKKSKKNLNDSKDVGTNM